jgi:hypothetical protein
MLTAEQPARVSAALSLPGDGLLRRLMRGNNVTLSENDVSFGL